MTCPVVPAESINPAAIALHEGESVRIDLDFTGRLCAGDELDVDADATAAITAPAR